MQNRMRWLVGVLGCTALISAACGEYSPRIPVGPSPSEPRLITYTGIVEEPHYGRGNSPQYGSQGVPGIRVTILGGQTDGWTTVTDAEGNFSYPDHASEEKHPDSPHRWGAPRCEPSGAKDIGASTAEDSGAAGAAGSGQYIIATGEPGDFRQWYGCCSSEKRGGIDDI